MQKPTLQECIEYCNNPVQANLFFHYFESNGWKVGKNPMKNWRSALTGWCKRAEAKIAKHENKVDQALANTSNKLIDLLWKRMTEIYGHKWVSSYGATPTKPWIEVINSLQPEEIATGLEKLLESGESWPPSLVEFGKMCRSEKKPVVAITYAPDKKEVHRKREKSKEAMSAAMSAIRGVLYEIP